MLTGVLDNVLINGDFLPGLWTRLRNPEEGIECPVWRHTFAADRWKIRYAKPQGGPVTQAISTEVPDEIGATRSLEIRGSSALTENVFLGQRIESDESPRYRRRLVFSAWVKISGTRETESALQLMLSTAHERDVFDVTLSKNECIQAIPRVPTNQWTQIECEVDALHFSPNGLDVELKFPTELLNTAEARVRVTAMRLVDVAHLGHEMERPAALEAMLARRFFQRHDCYTVNSLGRPLVINKHELHFQYSFAEMRSLPACTLPQDNEHFCVFDLEGFPQTGFTYDVTYRSRGSVMVRATKENHCVRDGYLSFVGNGGAILLDAEI